MDTSNAHTIDEQAAQARYIRLQQMQIDRKCPPVPEQVVVTVDSEGKATATKVKAEMNGPTPPASAAPTAPTAIVTATSQTSPPQAATIQNGQMPAVASKRMFAAEQFAKAAGCNAPVATVNISAATYETLTVKCSNLEPMSIRCDDTACRELK